MSHKKNVKVDVSGNIIDNYNPIQNISSNKQKVRSYLRNCYIKPRDGDKLFFIDDFGTGPVLLATLDDYAIIPLQEYDKYIKWKNRKIRVLNGGK